MVVVGILRVYIGSGRRVLFFLICKKVWDIKLGIGIIGVII